MAVRLLATYEYIDKEGHPAGLVRLPVVGYAPPDENGRERPRVLLLGGDDPNLVDFDPDSTLETQYGTLEALLIDAVDDPIPARRVGSPRSGSRGSTRIPSCWAPTPCSRGSPNRRPAFTTARKDTPYS